APHIWRTARECPYNCSSRVIRQLLRVLNAQPLARAVRQMWGAASARPRVPQAECLARPGRAEAHPTSARVSRGRG
ncbi:MAG TPA: hypothetical protein VF266_23075, partial [Thermoanaerobaculia bacterium]